MNEILKTFQTDIPCWLELSDLYLAVSDFEVHTACMHVIECEYIHICHHDLHRHPPHI